MVEFTHSEAGLKIEGLEPSDTLLRFKLKRRRTSDSDERRDDISKSNGKGGNPLLILLLVCVIVTWGVAATLVFDLVDYKGLVEKGKNIGSEIQEEDIKNAVGALYPFQYEIVRHPIRSLGQGLINIDDYITEALSPRKGWADELPAEDIIPQKRVKANKTIEFKKYPKL
ncbi:unnamed protein product [Oikopleura dioica]|uniref:Uncharacterized protein n=1 Tax=Oikopleura dioica TaxID=34765 RepID=E4X5C5_OIKDI|nr:unnamed protein product [Oikopleura dioica]CBY40388.1 unnamed protein product [Oikopleura dioica]